MEKKWYPVIDYLACVECSACVTQCPHGVFDTSKAPSPVVINPAACIDHCHGCGNKCPVGAITYVGDDTGWTPPKKQQTEEDNESFGCDCGGGRADSDKTVLVEYLYLDLNTCDRCIGADEVLERVMQSVAPALELAGYTVELRKVQITTEELARQYRFLASPTIRVNGRDICEAVQENACGCCGEISGTDVTCRTFMYKGQSYEVPPQPMLAEELLRAALDMKPSTCNCEPYLLPENLKHFFEGKAAKNACCCGGNC